MSEFAPAAMFDLFKVVDQVIPEAVNSGITGKAAHKSGYHRSYTKAVAADPNNYSTILADDKNSDHDAVAALDISVPPELMKIVTARALAAARAGDPRFYGCREILGTVTGSTTTGWNFHATGSGSRSKVGIIPSSGIDSSHLWHVHISMLRKYATDPAACKAVGAVLAGLPAPNPEPVPKIIINGVEYDDITSVSVAAINTARDTGAFSRHTYYMKHWLVKMAGS